MNVNEEPTPLLQPQGEELQSLKAAVQRRRIEGSNLAERLRTLAGTIAGLGPAAPRSEVSRFLESEAPGLVRHDVCLLSLVNRKNTHYTIHEVSPKDAPGELGRHHVPVSEGLSGWVIVNGASIVGDPRSGPAFSTETEGGLEARGIRSLLIVPMKSGAEVTGSLTFGKVQDVPYGEDDLVVAEWMALHLSTILKNSAVAEDARKRISQIELISEVSRQLTSMLNLEELLTVAAAAIQKTFSYFDVTVFLLSDDKTELILEAHSGSFVDFLPHGYRQTVDRGIIGLVAANGTRILCNDVAGESRYVAYEYHNTRSELATPITVDGEVVGVLNVEDTKLHAFDETDAVVLETLSVQLGNAIRNARLYDEVRRSNMKLLEVDRMKSDFLGIVSHDFRSPLSSIILAGKALLKHEAVQQVSRVKEYLQIIVDQANRLNQLAEDTLSITRLESGQLRYYFKVVNVNRLIQDAVSMVRFSSRHTVSFDVRQEVSFIKGDQSKLRQVLQNIIGNAVKYSPQGGHVNIVAAEMTPDLVLFSVSDEGIGIPADQTDRLFKKFSRIDADDSNQIKGAGLGLWICREIVEAHGGKIWVESEPGKGTTVKFTLSKAHEEPVFGPEAH